MRNPILGISKFSKIAKLFEFLMKVVTARVHVAFRAFYTSPLSDGAAI